MPDLKIRIERTRNGSIEVTRGNVGYNYSDDCLDVVVKKILKHSNVGESEINGSIGRLSALEEFLNRGCYLIFTINNDSCELNIMSHTRKGSKGLTYFCSSKKFGVAKH